MIPPPPISTLFPYTTLFRSNFNFDALGMIEQWKESAKAPDQLIVSHVKDGKEVGTRLRSEEHTSELQSPYDLVCRLLLEKKKKQIQQKQQVQTTHLNIAPVK